MNKPLHCQVFLLVRVAVILFFSGVIVIPAYLKADQVRISYPNTSICCLALFAAQQWKIFEQNGLDVESIQMRSQAANSALASGDIHYVAGVGPNSVAATLRGIPSKAVWFASERLIYSVMVRPELKSLKDLRGKRIGITGLGGTSDVALRIALEAAGENFKDFTVIALGAPQLMSGLESGAIEAAQLNSPFIYHAKKKGFREVLDIGAYVQMPLGGLTASAAAIQNRSVELKRVLRSLQTAKKMLLQSKEKGIDLIMRTIRVDREVAGECSSTMKRAPPATGCPARGHGADREISTNARAVYRQENSLRRDHRHPPRTGSR